MGGGLSAEVIVLRAFMGNQAVAEDLLAHGFAPELMPTREGRSVAEALLALRKQGTALSLDNLRRALAQRGRLGGGFKRYLVGLEWTPRCSRLHAVAHLQMIRLDRAMAQVDNVCQRSLACAGLPGEPEKAPNEGGAPLQERQADVPSVSSAGACGGSGPGNGRGLRQRAAVPHPGARA